MSSCADDPVKLLVIEHIQTLDENTKIDLNVKISQLQCIDTVRKLDSAAFYKAEIDRRKALYFGSDNVDTITAADVEKGIEDIIQGYEQLYELSGDYRDLRSIRENTNELDDYKKLENTYHIFEIDGNDILYYIYECHYTINNPILNNAKQSITKKYIIDPEKTNVINYDKSSFNFEL